MHASAINSRIHNFAIASVLFSKGLRPHRWTAVLQTRTHRLLRFHLRHRRRVLRPAELARRRRVRGVLTGGPHRHVLRRLRERRLSARLRARSCRLRARAAAGGAVRERRRVLFRGSELGGLPILHLAQRWQLQRWLDRRLHGREVW